jgi:hypothetical protein
MSKSPAILARFRRLRDLGCVACRMRGIYTDQVDMHHLTDRGDREKSGADLATIPLCVWHHRGYQPNKVGNLSSTQLDSLLGPSRELAKKRFVAEFGTDRELLERVDYWLANGEVTHIVWPGRAGARRTD